MPVPNSSKTHKEVPPLVRRSCPRTSFQPHAYSQYQTTLRWCSSRLVPFMPTKTSLARARQRTTVHKRRNNSTSYASVPREENGMAHPSPSRESHQAPLIPELFTNRPPIRDLERSETSVKQDDVQSNCMADLKNALHPVRVNHYGVPSLARQHHIRFLEFYLGNLPGGFKSLDASRPWVFYWCLNSLALLGADVSKYRDGLVATARSMQNESGGFGGGFGQKSHLATTYATVLALAIVGGESAYQLIDRRAMWKWLCSLKQPDGGFRVTLGGEIDVRQVLLPRPAASSLTVNIGVRIALLS